MLFDLGWSEILLIGVVALVFIGPKDLPKAMRLAGYWVRKARSLSREFQSSIDQMIREAELDDMRQQLKKASEFDLDREFHNAIDPSGSLSESLKPPELPSFSPVERLPPPVPEGPEGAPEAAVRAEAPHQAAAGDTAPEQAHGDPAHGDLAHSDPVAAEPRLTPGPTPGPGSAAPVAGRPAPPEEPGAGGHDAAAVAVEIVPPRP
jgi:sec-independent protein translocase protein TatB